MKRFHNHFRYHVLIRLCTDLLGSIWTDLLPDHLNAYKTQLLEVSFLQFYLPKVRVDERSLIF